LPQWAEQSVPLMQTAIGEWERGQCECRQAAGCGGLLQRKRRQTQRAIFDKRSGSLKSGYRFVQTIYRLPDIV